MNLILIHFKKLTINISGYEGIVLHNEAISGTGSVDIIKFDVEGAGFSIFKSSIFDLSIPMVVGEVHEDLTGKSVEDFIQLFPGRYSKKMLVGNGRYLINLSKYI